MDKIKRTCVEIFNKNSEDSYEPLFNYEIYTYNKLEQYKENNNYKLK